MWKLLTVNGERMPRRPKDVLVEKVVTNGCYINFGFELALIKDNL